MCVCALLKLYLSRYCDREATVESNIQIMVLLLCECLELGLFGRGCLGHSDQWLLLRPSPCCWVKGFLHGSWRPFFFSAFSVLWSISYLPEEGRVFILGSCHHLLLVLIRQTHRGFLRHWLLFLLKSFVKLCLTLDVSLELELVEHIRGLSKHLEHFLAAEAIFDSHHALLFNLEEAAMQSVSLSLSLAKQILFMVLS